MPDAGKRREPLYKGKAKSVYATDDPDQVLIHFRDDATAFDGQKQGTIAGKGAINRAISATLFGLLEEAGIRTHFIRSEGDRGMVCRMVTIVPLEVVVRNIAAGSLAERIGVDEGTALPGPVVEFYYKRDDLGDPLLTEAHIRLLELVSEAELAELRRQALAINEHLREYLAKRGIDLVDFKLEFGRADGELLLADEISPDTCRMWDAETGQRLDKDRFRRDLGDVEAAYTEMLRRIATSGA